MVYGLQVSCSILRVTARELLLCISWDLYALSPGLTSATGTWDPYVAVSLSSGMVCMCPPSVRRAA